MRVLGQCLLSVGVGRGSRGTQNLVRAEIGVQSAVPPPARAGQTLWREGSLAFPTVPRGHLTTPGARGDSCSPPSLRRAWLPFDSAATAVKGPGPSPLLGQLLDGSEPRTHCEGQPTWGPRPGHSLHRARAACKHGGLPRGEVSSPQGPLSCRLLSLNRTASGLFPSRFCWRKGNPVFQPHSMEEQSPSPGTRPGAAKLCEREPQFPIGEAGIHQLTGTLSTALGPGQSRKAGS